MGNQKHRIRLLLECPRVQLPRHAVPKLTLQVLDPFLHQLQPLFLFGVSLNQSNISFIFRNRPLSIGFLKNLSHIIAGDRIVGVEEHRLFEGCQRTAFVPQPLMHGS